MLGYHLLIELYDSDPEKLNNVQYIVDVFTNIAQLLKSEIIEISYHEFELQGVTVLCIVSASHFSFHSWPEYKFASIDVFVCTENIDFSVCIDFLQNAFKSSKMSYLLINRGLNY